MYQYIPIPPVLSCSSIGMYHEMFACKYTSIQAAIHTNTTAKFSSHMLNVACIGMYFCVYLYELVRIWYVLVCIYGPFSTRVSGENRWYWYVLRTYLPVFWYVFARIHMVVYVFGTYLSVMRFLVLLRTRTCQYRINTYQYIPIYMDTYQYIRVPEPTRPLSLLRAPCRANGVSCRLSAMLASLQPNLTRPSRLRSKRQQGTSPPNK